MRISGSACLHHHICMTAVRPFQPGGYLMLQVWHLDVNVTILDHAGNLTDACLLSAVAALMVFRRPEVEVDTSNSGSGIARTLVLSPAVREPLPLSLHQLPLSTTFALFGVRSWAFSSMSHQKTVRPRLVQRSYQCFSIHVCKTIQLGDDP